MISSPSGSLKKYVPPKAESVVIVVEARELVQELADRLKAFPPSLVHLGQGLMASQLLQALKDSDDDEEKVQLQWRCEGDFGSLYADSFGLGRVRVAISEPQATVQDLKASMGPGLFQVRRVFKNKNLHPFTGIVSARGHVGEDLVEYLEKSEQKSCGVSLTVKLAWDESRKENPVVVESARGYLIHILPQALDSEKDRLLASWDKHLNDLGPLSQWDLGVSQPSEITDKILQFLLGKNPDPRAVAWEKQMHLFCPCSLERAERALALLTPREREGLKESPDDVQLKMSCEYCGTVYSAPIGSKAIYS